MIMSEMMRGATRARQYIADYLSDAVPRYITRARTEWGYTDANTYMLPLPKKYDSYDPLVAHEYPVVGSLIRRTGNWRRRDIIDAEEHYSARYSVLVFVWVATPESANGTIPDATYDETLRLRDDMLGIIRTCLLSKPSLGTDQQVTLDEGTLSEDYLDAIRVSEESNRWLAGGTISFDMQISEQNVDVPYGTVEIIGLTNSNIGLIEQPTE